jgi:hypothetical protein
MLNINENKGFVRSYTAIALESCELLVLSQKVFNLIKKLFR